MHVMTARSWRGTSTVRNRSGIGIGGMACNTLRQSFVLSNRNEYVKIYNSYEARIDVGRSTSDAIVSRWQAQHILRTLLEFRLKRSSTITDFCWFITLVRPQRTLHWRERDSEIERQREIERDDNKSRRIKSVFNFVVNSAKRNLTSSPSPSLSVSPRTD